jgi:hypothetical protein
MILWRPIDTEFFGRKHPVEIACIGDAGEANRLRALLEGSGAVVLCHWIGTPDDFLKVISQGTKVAPYLIVSAHGDDNGIVFGEYAEGIGIDVSMLKEESMPPESIKKHISLPGCVVLNLACSAGEPPMAEAFMHGGLKAYIGTVEPDPQATAHALFVMHFFYSLFAKGRSVREAWEHAAAYDEESRLFVLYDEEGCHRVR